jgi:hypothetical protein
MTRPDLDAAAQFLAAHGRILDRRRFERLFGDGDATPVRDAVAAYRNADGGFGHALEPDGRTPGSQPVAVELGLRALDQADAWDDELVAGACDWLERTAPAEGGTTFVAPSADGWPHAPWWQPQEGLPASLVTTGQLAGTLHARKVDHPWLDRATAWLWDQVESLTPDGGSTVNAYEMRGVLGFLQQVPDRARAERAFAPVGRLVVESGLLTLDPDASGEVHGPLDFAPLPDSIARAVVDADVVSRHLDRLAAGQRDDGGWTFNWPAWSPAAESDWRGWITVDALYVLRANGRLAS